MTFTTAGAALGQGRNLPEQYAPYADDLEDVLDAAEAWQAGRLPLSTAANLGTVPYRDRDGRPHPSPRFTRYLAMVHAAPDDPRRAALLAMIDRMIRANHIVTPFGIVSQDELHQHDQAVDRLNWAPRTEQAA